MSLYHWQLIMMMGMLLAVFMDTNHNQNHYGVLLFILSCIGWYCNTENLSEMRG